MKKYKEIIQEVDNQYVKNNYLQLMLNYQNYLLLFGNKNMMYYNHANKQVFGDYTNEYLNDKRRFEFPFSNIPEHTEKICLKKYNFVNQILELNIPYLSISDGHIIQMIAFKNNNKTYIHSKALTEIINNRKIIVNREEIEQYLQKGYFKENNSASKMLDYNDVNLPDKYSLVKIIDVDGFIYDDKKLLTQKEIIKKRQERLYDVLKNLTPFIENKIIGSNEIIKDLQRAISTLDEIEPFNIISPKLMIKIKNDKEIEIEEFSLKYLSKDKYEITLADIQVADKNITSSNEKKHVKINKIREPKIKRY